MIQSDLAVVREVESLLVDATNGEDVPEVPEVVARYFRGKIDTARLKIQLLMLPEAISTAFVGSSIEVKKVMNVRTTADALNQNKTIKRMLDEVHVDKLLRAYLTFPVTSATAERLFFPFNVSRPF